MNEYHKSQDDASDNPPPLIGGFLLKFFTSPFFSVDKLTLVGNLKHGSLERVYQWSKSPDLNTLPFAPYPYRHALQSQSGVYFAFKDPGADGVPDVRIEFNPNNQSTPPECVKALVDMMREVRMTRIDLAIDYPVDLSGFHYSTTVPKAGAIWYGRSGTAETFYLGKRSSGSMYRIYNKAREQKLPDVTWWRIEQELHFRPGEDWRDKEAFSDLHVAKPAHYLNVVDAAVIEYLRAHPQAWGELTPYLRQKYRKMLNDEEGMISLSPTPHEVFKENSWKVDAVINEYVKLMGYQDEK